MRVLKTSRSYKKEFKRQLKFALTAAIGFTIAYAWRESIIQIMHDASRNLALQAGFGTSPLYMPLFTTIIGVSLIFILSKLLKDKS